ncbi:hypothetical protein [Clostridium hydrogeniformans]|uniref:hypothetical protein n=1 Tax=Clostridium hydrogeniformans TaxID=349933 RepID=UPI000481E233|nr:hypothetical protein [Clostridium hydrogeniformans]
MKKLYLNIFLSFILLLFSFTLFKFLTPKSISEGTSSELTEYINNINSLNENILTFSDISSNNEELKSKLSETIEELSSLKDSLSNLNPNNISNNFLENGVEQNLLFYKQLIGILNNPKGKDIDNSISALMKYGQKTSEYYDNLSSPKILFTSQGESFMKSFYKDLHPEIMTLKEKENLRSEHKNFLLNFEGIIETFFENNKEYSSLIEKCRGNTLEFEDILKDIDKTAALMDELNLKLYSLSYPSSGVEAFNAFNESLNLYSSYIKEVRKAIYSEMSSSKKLSKSDIDKLYVAVESGESKFKNSISIFENNFKQYKELAFK